MTVVSPLMLAATTDLVSSKPPIPDPRQVMAERLPRVVQPFLTWLTARPAPGETPAPRSAHGFVAGSLAWTVGGAAVAALPLLMAGWPAVAWLLLPLGLLAATFGLGLFQVVLFHHCSHGTVFQSRSRNRLVGRLISSFLLFKRFDDYQREHMLHHSAKKLLTEEDEFADFVLGMCRLEPGLPKAALWRRVLWLLISPRFHAQFLHRRIRASLFTGDRAHDWAGRAFWLAVLGTGALTGHLGVVALVWVLPLTLLLQQATVFRILVEHRFPEPDLIARRDRDFVCHATVGVFPGRMPPTHGLMAWTAWWAEMLTWHLFVRLFVLVGDAAGYFEAWGLLRAVDENLATLAATRPETIGR